jgi:ribosomal protein S18 acetylase RimI-like enzyme
VSDQTSSARIIPPALKSRFQEGSTRYTPRFATRHAADMAVVSPPPIIAGDVLLRVLDVARDWRELSRFRCGYSGKKAEEEIHLAAKQLVAGIPVERGTAVTGPHYQRIIALENSTGEVISWCGVTRRHLCEITPTPVPPGGYIFAIGTAYAYRGRRLDVEGTRPSDAVMRHALEILRDDLGDGEEMPYVWARVLPDNRPSNRLFRDHHFDLYEARGFEQMIRARPAGFDPGVAPPLDDGAREHPLAA